MGKEQSRGQITFSLKYGSPEAEVGRKFLSGTATEVLQVRGVLRFFMVSTQRTFAIFPDIKPGMAEYPLVAGMQRLALGQRPAIFLMEGKFFHPVEMFIFELQPRLRIGFQYPVEGVGDKGVVFIRRKSSRGRGAEAWFPLLRPVGACPIVLPSGFFLKGG